MLEKVNQIRNSIETFNDAEFVSVVSENTALVRNINNNSEWTINYSESKEGILSFDGESAEMVEGPDASKEELYEETVKDLHETFVNVFSKDNAKAVDILREKILTLPFVEDVEEEEVVSEDSLVTEGKLDAVGTLAEKFAGKVKAFDEVSNTFEASGNMFDESGKMKAESMIDPQVILEAYEQKVEKRRMVEEAVDKTLSFEEAVKDHYSDEEVVKTILENITSESAKPNVAITKALVTAKANGAEFVVAEERKFLAEAFSESFPEVEASVISEDSTRRGVDFVYNQISNNPKFKFLKYNTGIYTRDDVDTIAKELETVISHTYHDLNEEEMMFVNELYTKVMYMARTNQIDDEVVTEAIKTFNKKFGKDGSAKYRDEDQSLGWHGLAQSGEGNADHNPVGVEA